MPVVDITATPAWDVSADYQSAWPQWEWGGNPVGIYIGATDGGWLNTRNGGGMFFQVPIKQGVLVNEAHLVLKGAMDSNGGTVNGHITGGAIDNAGVFLSLANYRARRGTQADGADNTQRTVAQVAWDNIVNWMTGNTINSPDIKSVIQEILSRPGWVNNNTLCLWVDDHADRSDHYKWRCFAGTGNIVLDHVVLHIDYSAGGGVSSNIPHRLLSENMI